MTMDKDVQRRLKRLTDDLAGLRLWLRQRFKVTFYG